MSLTLLVDDRGIILGAEGEGDVGALAGRRYLDFARTGVEGNPKEVAVLLAEILELFDGRRSVVEYYNWNRVAGDLDRIGQEIGAVAAREAAS